LRNAIVRYKAQNFIGEAGLAANAFDLLVGKSRRLQHRALWTTLLLSRMSVRRLGSPFMANCALRYGHFR
jgi:hypothetical protein